MRVLVVVVTTGAALAFIAASCLMNWTFMSSLGKSDFEQQILGVVSIAISALIAMLPTLILWAFREKRWFFVGMSVPAFLAFASFSMSSAVGFSAKNRGGAVEERNLATSRLGDVRKEIAAEEAKKAALGTPRPGAIIEEAMQGLEQDRKWRWSDGCKDASTEALRSFCKSYRDLKGEEARVSGLAP